MTAIKIVIYQKEQTLKEFAEIRLSTNAGKVYVKVKQDAADYILNGKTESIEFDNQRFNVITSEGIQNYLGLVFYKFGLQSTT